MVFLRSSSIAGTKSILSKSSVALTEIICVTQVRFRKHLACHRSLFSSTSLCPEALDDKTLKRRKKEVVEKKKNEESFALSESRAIDFLRIYF